MLQAKLHHHCLLGKAAVRVKLGLEVVSICLSDFLHHSDHSIILTCAFLDSSMTLTSSHLLLASPTQKNELEFNTRLYFSFKELHFWIGTTLSKVPWKSISGLLAWLRTSGGAWLANSFSQPTWCRSEAVLLGRKGSKIQPADESNLSNIWVVENVFDPLLFDGERNEKKLNTQILQLAKTMCPHI